MSTINSVQASIDSLRESFEKHVIEDHIVYDRTATIERLLNERTATIDNIQAHVKNMDERLVKQEIEAKANRDLLQDIKRILSIVRWSVLAIAAALIGDLLNYLIHFIHP